LAQGFARRQVAEEALRGIGQLLDLAAIDGLDDSVAAGEVTIEGANADPGAAGDLVQADRRSTTSEKADLAAATRRSRLRWLSARGLRRSAASGLDGSGALAMVVAVTCLLANGGVLRI